MAARGQAEEYYIYQAPNGELVISNKEPPPGSKIIEQLPAVTDREVPQAQEPGKAQPNGQTEGSVHPTNDGLVRAYVNIVFDNCSMVREIRVIQGSTGTDRSPETL
jgi:hypothetical protein